MGKVLTNEHVNDLARWAFGPTATARHLPHETRQCRCEVLVPLPNFSPTPNLLKVHHAHYGATWADVFAKAGWPFPDPPARTYIAIGQSIMVANGDVTEQIATASTITMATRIAKALNRT